jgi:hypothetical protein
MTQIASLVLNRYTHKKQLITPYVDADIKYFDLGIEEREKTKDQGKNSSDVVALERLHGETQSVAYGHWPKQFKLSTKPS